MASQYPRAVQTALGTLRGHMARYGYVPADVPIIQPADTFLTRAGDQILHKLFTFERHGVSLALRPEFTTPALRRYIADDPQGSSVARWQVAGIIFEDDPADGSMSFERASSGAECIGQPGAGAEAEIIAMAASGCALLGQPVATINLGDAQLLRAVLASRDIDTRTQRFVLSHISVLKELPRGVDYILDRFDAQVATPASTPALESAAIEQEFRVILETNERGRAMGGRTQADVARRLVQRQQRAAQREQLREVLEILAQLAHIRGRLPEVAQVLTGIAGSELWSSALTNWADVIRLLDVYGFSEDKVVVTPILARDWEYYSGLTFEVYTEDGHHVAGGGRYDEFARLIGAPRDIPAVGFTYYLDALLTGQTAQPADTLFLDVCAPANKEHGIRWAQLLRERGFLVRLAESACDGLITVVINPDASAVFLDNRYELSQCDDLIAAITRWR